MGPEGDTPIKEREHTHEELMEQAEALMKRSLEIHHEFDTEWRKKHENSFHNDEHIKAVHKSKELLIEEAVAGGEDPLGIIADLESWNNMLEKEGRASAKVTKEELADIMKEAVAAHDWGNIMSDITIDENGKIIPQYLETYTSIGAEDRSKAMYEKNLEYRLQKGELTEAEYLKRKALGCHLIDVTKPSFPVTDADRDRPFLVLVQVGDQIGNDYFSENDKRVEGLIEENANEPVKKNERLNEKAFRNFSVWRLAQLVPSEEKRKLIVEKIWKKEMKEVNQQYYDTDETYAEAHARLSGAESRNN